MYAVIFYGEQAGFAHAAISPGHAIISFFHFDFVNGCFSAVPKANNSRDALAQSLYIRTLNAIVRRVNTMKQRQPPPPPKRKREF